MADAMQVYECHNTACVLGSRKDPGKFTGGMTADQKNLLTGEPVEAMKEGKDFGAGVCPNCGELGRPAKTADGKLEIHKSIKGSDPNQKIHDRVNAEVLEQVTEPDKAQERLEQLVGKNV